MPAGVRYRVVKKIAHGGMAEIFLAFQSGAEGFQKPVVLKRILPSLASDPAFVRMLVDEAHIASTLNHSNLVQVLDLRHSGNEYFLVLEFVDGWSLEQVRRRAQKAKMKLPLPLVLYIVGSLCRGLAYMHARKRDGQSLDIVHRDVTPQNVLLSCEGEVKLADFGIAKAAGKREKSVTGVIKGKFAYMSPEQAAGGDLDARSDLFSVGTLLYLLTTGKKPFDGANDLEVILQVRKARFEKPSTVVRDFNLDVEKLIVRALRANVDRRWQSAEQMADKIDAILAGLGQPSGPAPLKRWLATLSERDGVKAAADATVEETEVSDVVPLGSHELDLEEISEVVAPPAEPPTRPGRRPTAAERPAEGPTVRRPNIYETPTVSAATQAARLAGGIRSLGTREVAADEPDGWLDRLGAAARRIAVRTLLILAVVGVAAYVARPYLPAWMTQPLEAWIHDLPLPLVGHHR
jgi:serine/threonine protein kinase